MRRGTNEFISGDGKFIGEEKKAIKRWEEYFKELLNDEQVNSEDEEGESENGIRDMKIIDPPTLDEITEMVGRLKNNKAPGEDNITPEIFKYGGDPVNQALHKLITTIWEKEKMPEKWNTGIICPHL